MDRRFAQLLGLGVLAGIAGCTPSFLSRTTTTQPTQLTQSYKETGDTPVAAAPDPAMVKEKVLPRRQPKAKTCVAGGDYALREAVAKGRTLPEKRQFLTEAKKAYQQALQIDPKCLEAHCGLARVYCAEEDHDRAITVYQGALKINPREPAVWFELGMCHCRSREWEPAIDALKRAADLDPENRQYANTVGFCLGRCGRFEDSLVYFSRVVGEAKARYNVARMMNHVGQSEDAKKQLRLALQQEPEFKDAQSLLNELDSGKPSQEIVPVEYEERKP